MSAPSKVRSRRRDSHYAGCGSSMVQRKRMFADRGSGDGSHRLLRLRAESGVYGPADDRPPPHSANTRRLIFVDPRIDIASPIDISAVVSRPGDFGRGPIGR